MNKRILFSPVGGTDPIKYLRDGSLLHICRVYMPDVVYLYLSNEMLERSRSDNRYCRTIQLLGEKLNHNFDIRLIERENLVNVQKYDFFYEDFRNEIIKIEHEMDDTDELILNMASGTPAMKSALMVMATLAEYRFRVIQVSSPKKSSNEEYEFRKDYDVELNWECDLDNEEGFENRCEEVKCFNLMRLLKIEEIKKHLTAYDYSAALSVASDISNDISDAAMCLIKVACERVRLNRNAISRLLSGDPYNIFPVREGDKQRIFEYALVLKLKVDKEEYADFIRGITPIVVDLLENILKKAGKTDINSFCSIGKKDKVRRWDQNKLAGTEELEILCQNFNGEFKYGPVYSSSLEPLIAVRCKSNPEIVATVKEILMIEGKLRNMAAHEIVSVTDEWFIQNTGKSAQNIMKTIMKLVQYSGIQTSGEDWKAYDRMNEKIMELLDE